jgi:hypothetical protein
MDLVFDEDGVWHIVDWKSDVVGGNLTSLIAHYAPQVGYYRRAWEAFTKQPAKAGLYFMDSGHVHWLGDNEDKATPAAGAASEAPSPRQRSLFEEP